MIFHDVPRLPCLARRARFERLHEPIAELWPGMVHCEAARRARKPCAPSPAGVRVSPASRTARADRPDARAGDGASPRGSYGGEGPAGTTSDHPDDAAPTAVGAGSSGAMRQNIDGSSVLWRQGEGEWCNVHVSSRKKMMKNANDDVACSYNQSIKSQRSKPRAGNGVDQSVRFKLKMLNK